MLWQKIAIILIPLSNQKIAITVSAFSTVKMCTTHDIRENVPVAADLRFASNASCARNAPTVRNVIDVITAAIVKTAVTAGSVVIVSTVKIALAASDFTKNNIICSMNR